MYMAAGLSNPTPDRLVKFAFTSALFVDPLAVLNAVFGYAPKVADDREWIEMHAYSEEALNALMTLFFGMKGMSQPTGAAPQPQETM